MDKCTKCDGYGLVPDSDPSFKMVIALVDCPDCHGLGRNGE